MWPVSFSPGPASDRYPGPLPGPIEMLNQKQKGGSWFFLSSTHIDMTKWQKEYREQLQRTMEVGTDAKRVYPAADRDRIP